MAAKQGPEDGSHLFLVRVWMDNRSEVGVAGREGAQLPPTRNGCRGRVQHVISGEAASFADWNALADAIRGMAANPDVSRMEPP